MNTFQQQQQQQTAVPMTTAALPPRVTRPSTAPSSKPNQRVTVPTGLLLLNSPNVNNNISNNNGNNIINTNTVVQQQQYSRPSSAQVVSFSQQQRRPLGTAGGGAHLPLATGGGLQRPNSAAAYSSTTRPSSGGTARSTIVAGNHFSTANTVTTTANNSNPISMSNRSAAVASVKGDILLLQRTVDKISSLTGGSSHQQNESQASAAASFFPQKDGLFEVEQILSTEFPPLLPGDELLAADMHAKLLELFVQRLNLGCLAVLSSIDPDSLEHVSLVSRTSAINTLLQKFSSKNRSGGGGGTQQQGEQNNFFNNNNRNKATVQTQTHSIGGLSAPEITDFQVLLKEQREIQNQMKHTLAHGVATSQQNSARENYPPHPTTTTSATTTKGDKAQLRVLKEQLEEANKLIHDLRIESSSLQAKLAKSEAVRNTLQQELNESHHNNNNNNNSSSVATKKNDGKSGNNSGNISASNSKSASTNKNNNNTNIASSSNNNNNGMGDGTRSRKGSNGPSTSYPDENNINANDDIGSVGGDSSNNGYRPSSANKDALAGADSSATTMWNRMTPEAALAAALSATVGFFRLDPEILTQVGLEAVLDSPKYVPERAYCEQLYTKISSVVSDVLAQVQEENDAAAAVAAAAAASSIGGGNKTGNLFNNAMSRIGAGKGVGGGAGAAAASGIGAGKSMSKKDKNENSPEALGARIGAMWWILEKQNATLQAMQLLLVKQHDQLEQASKDSEALDKRSKRMISVLEEKLGHAKSVVQRLMEENEILSSQAQNSNNNNNNNNLDDSRASSSNDNNNNSRSASRKGFGVGADAGSQQQQWGPNVRTSIDDPTPDEERKMYERNELRLQRRILELEHTNSESHAFVEQARLSASATHREIQVLKARIQLLERELEAKRSSEDTAVTEATRLREEREGTKKDLREKSISATENEQKVSRLEVELHIAQNIVADLRRREVQLEKIAADAKQHQDILKTKMIGERETHSRELARLREENRAAKHEVVVANQILADERQKAIANEREIERLRGLDLQLEALQQNFANYAGAKQAQKEAHDEEERALQACVELIGQDVFALPFDEDQGEEEVELLLRRLRDTEESMAAEERTRDTLRNTVVGFKDERSGRKQLATLMSRRYNAIQIFACEQRLRQLQLETKLQDALVQNDEHRVQYEGAMVELSHARSHEQALLQRNSELEQQRRETLKAKETAEADVKLLRQTIQRMRIANEEQEAAIVELGTKLKRKEFGSDQQQQQQDAAGNSLSLGASAASLKGSLKTRGLR